MALSKHFQCLFPLFSLALFLMLTNKVHSQGTTFTYDRFLTNTLGLNYQGGTHVPSGSQILRLTKTDSSGLPESWTVGRVLFSRPLQFWQRSPARQVSFRTSIRFVIKPNTNGAADGIAFFIAPVNTTIPSGSAGANLGIFGSSGTASSLFAVEFDTFVNPGWDPSCRHIGIDINSRESRATRCLDTAIGLVVRAQIHYDANTKLISVFASSGPQYTEVHYVFDLKTILPERVQVGISSATGQDQSALGIHEINFWQFNSTLASTNLNDNEEEAYIQQYV